MCESIPTEISIGGKIRAELVHGLCKAIADERVSLEWDDPYFYFRPATADELLAARQDQEGARQPRHSDQRANFWRSYMRQELLEREQFASDDDGGPLILFTTMMLMAQAVD